MLRRLARSLDDAMRQRAKKNDEPETEAAEKPKPPALAPPTGVGRKALKVLSDALGMMAGVWWFLVLKTVEPTHIVSGGGVSGAQPPPESFLPFPWSAPPAPGPVLSHPTPSRQPKPTPDTP